MEPQMEKNHAKSGYGKSWKKWVGIYLAVGAVVYLVIYLVATSGGKSGY
jgi:hypothetical protein